MRHPSEIQPAPTRIGIIHNPDLLICCRLPIQEACGPGSSADAFHFIYLSRKSQSTVILSNTANTAMSADSRLHNIASLKATIDGSGLALCLNQALG